VSTATVPRAAQPTVAAPEPRISRRGLDDRIIAAITGLLGVLVAFELVRVMHLDPVSIRGAALPLGVGLAGFAGLVGALYRWWRRLRTALIGVTVGAYAGWVALVTKGALFGSVMSYGGNNGDAHRITAQAAKYATSWTSTDVFQPNTPSDYPPLYTWLTGRASQLLGEPAWQLMQNTQVLWLAATVVVAYALWRHLAPPVVAAPIAILTFLADSNPIKPYEVITLAATVPWLLATFARGPRPRLHWLPAGIIGGLIFLTYNGYLVFLALGVALVAWWAWRDPSGGRPYLWYLAKVAGVAFVVASWYLLPYVWAMLTRAHGSFGSDTFASPDISTDPLPLHFFDVSPAGALQLIGIAGLVVYLRRTWWARPLAALLGSAYVYFGLGALRFVATKHTMFYHYAVGPIILIGLIAGVLTVAETVTVYRAVPVRRAAAVLGVAVLAWSSLVAWHAWEPTTDLTGAAYPRVVAGADNNADQAHRESTADLSRSRFAPVPTDSDALPAALIEAAVAQRYGSSYRPMVLTVDESLFAFDDWYAFIGAGPGVSPALDQWHERAALLATLASVHDPQAFADLVAHNGFGPIDVFVLRDDSGSLTWRAASPAFHAEQFSAGAFDRVDLPNRYVLFVRHRS
jgi:hypothetical protein